MGNGIICIEPSRADGLTLDIGYVKSRTHKQPMLFLSS